MKLEVSIKKLIKGARNITLFRNGVLYKAITLNTERSRIGLKEELKEEVYSNGCTKIRFEDRRGRIKEMEILILITAEVKEIC